MIVSELIDLLLEYPENVEVFVEYNNVYQMAINPIQKAKECNIDEKDGGRFIVDKPRGKEVLILEVYQ